ncbi:Plasmid stabilization system [sediment metagenome]|uniref:Plasmid stabilization system n=1 Tax=sediment metagenome TaxID=749907 RepID=D9PI74_9ZZZZ
MTVSLSKIHLTSDFEKAFHRLSQNLKELTKRKDLWFRANPFDPHLRTHKLKGELTGFWSYSINYEIRVLFRFLKSDEVIYYDIGTHEIYR